MTDPGSAPVRVGEILAGKYRVERVLGQGAMGVVVAAMHVDLQEMRAIKFMLPASLGDADQLERFLREARAAARLKSQHAAKVHDVGRFENGAPYIVMEFLEGTDLKRYLDTRGPLPVMEAVGFVMQACEALAEAHAAGIVHRDLKPANLYLTTGVGGVPCVKVLDFGIAKIGGSAPGAMEMTKTTELLGTPLYMSPEQMRSTRNVDARTDVWALGVLLYRMLTGKTPFTGSTVTEICSAVIADPVEPPSASRPDIPRTLEAIILRCLEKSPAQRPANAAELAAALGGFVRESQALAAGASQRYPGPVAAPGVLPASGPVAPPGALTASGPVVATPAAVSSPLTASGPLAAPGVLPASGPVAAPGALTASGPVAAPGALTASGPITASPGPAPGARAAATAPPRTLMLDPSASPPAAAAQTAALGQSTARASTWTQSAQPAEAPRAGSRAPLFAAGGLVLVAALVGGGLFWRSRAATDPSVSAAGDASAAATSAAPTVVPSGPVPASSAEPQPTVSPTATSSAPVATSAPAPASAPAATGGPAAAASPSARTATPAPKPTSAAPAPTSKKKDAFGNDRK